MNEAAISERLVQFGKDKRRSLQAPAKSVRAWSGYRRKEAFGQCVCNRRNRPSLILWPRTSQE